MRRVPLKSVGVCLRTYLQRVSVVLYLHSTPHNRHKTWLKLQMLPPWKSVLLLTDDSTCLNLDGRGLLSIPSSFIGSLHNLAKSFNLCTSDTPVFNTDKVNNWLIPFPQLALCFFFGERFFGADTASCKVPGHHVVQGGSGNTVNDKIIWMFSSSCDCPNICPHRITFKSHLGQFGSRRGSTWSWGYDNHKITWAAAFPLTK